jgi:5-formyltetrahydrofolate cyclo-ligase
VSGAAAGAKALQRALLRGRLARLAAEERQSKSREVAERLAALLGERQYDRLLLHRALPTEVATERLFAAALERGQAVFAPRVEGPRLCFLRVLPDTRWVRSVLGVIEPEAGEPLDSSELARGSSVIVVPGLAFDESGGRLGRGGGHYDRFLRAARSAGRVEVIASAFDIQIVSDVPRAAHDEPVDLIVTETRVLVAPRVGG